MTRTALYRHFDAQGTLLYVGISLDAANRLKTHLGSSAWAEEIATVTIQQHPTRGDAERAEREAIRAERPKYNKTHRPVADGLTVAGICDVIGRQTLADTLGVGVTAVSAACVANRFPAKWFVLVTERATSLGLECPITLFNFIDVPRPRKAKTRHKAVSE